MGKKYPHYGKSMSTNFPVFPHTMDFVAFPRVMENWWGNPCISHMMKYITRWYSNEKKHPYYGKSMGTNFPGFPLWIGFAVFSHAMGNWWRNPRISHVMKYTRSWQSNGKKPTILWEKYEYQFLKFSPCNGFCYIFLWYWKLMEKPIHLPCDEVYHRMSIRWGNDEYYRKLMGKRMHFSSNINEVIRDNFRSFFTKRFTHKKTRKMQTSDFHSDTFIRLESIKKQTSNFHS